MVFHLNWNINLYYSKEKHKAWQSITFHWFSAVNVLFSSDGGEQSTAQYQHPRILSQSCCAQGNEKTDSKAVGLTLTVCVCAGLHVCFAELNNCPGCPGLSICPLIEHRFPAAQSSAESPWTGRKRKSLWLEIDGYSILCVRTEPCAWLRGSQLFHSAV